MLVKFVPAAKLSEKNQTRNKLSLPVIKNSD